MPAPNPAVIRTRRTIGLSWQSMVKPVVGLYSMEIFIYRPFYVLYSLFVVIITI